MEAIIQKTSKEPSLNENCISFKDPAGSVFLKDNAVFRLVAKNWIPTFKKCQKSKTLQSLIARGSVIPSKILRETDNEILLEHPKIPFVTYPHEWTPNMLFEAGCLTLELCEKLHPEQIGLKDATPRNILFFNNRPIFIDALSFEERHANDATWRPFDQFLRMFIYPLILHKACGITPQQYFLANQEGMDASGVYKILGIRAFTPKYFSLVALPHFLSRVFKSSNQNSSYSSRYVSSKAEANFILKVLFKHLKRGLERIYSKTSTKSHWTFYTSCHCPYDNGELEEKISFIDSVLKTHKPKKVLDLGANTGTFSKLAAESGAEVLAIDSDMESLETIHTKSDKMRVSVLHMDLTRPSSAIGWDLKECLSYRSRFENQFDLSLALALFHHIINAGIKLPDFVRFLAASTRKNCVVEYVDPSDTNFISGLKGRTELAQGICRSSFEKELQRYFTIEKTHSLKEGKRILYSLSKNAELGSVFL